MGWTKFYSDCTRIHTEPESWSKTPLENMNACKLVHDNQSITIKGSGHYWQSDDFIAEYMPGKTHADMIRRRIEFCLDRPLIGRVTQTRHHLEVDFNASIDADLKDDVGNIIVIDGEEVQARHWLVLEIDIKKGVSSLYISPNRI